MLDLDETLIHCNEDQSAPFDVKVPVSFPTGEFIEAGINIRPFAKSILMDLADHFEVLVFTASHSCYANPVIDFLELVDNAAYSYSMQLKNGIPIVPFYSNKEDRELSELKGFLMSLKDVEDVRPLVGKTFKGPVISKYANNMNTIFKKIFEG